MIALGIALIGVAVAISVCLCMGPAAWPFLALLLPAIPAAATPGVVVLNGLAQIVVASLYGGVASMLALSGFTGGALSIANGVQKINEGLGNKNSAGTKMHELHGSFFRRTPG